MPCELRLPFQKLAYLSLASLKSALSLGGNMVEKPKRLPGKRVAEVSQEPLVAQGSDQPQQNQGVMISECVAMYAHHDMLLQQPLLEALIVFVQY